MADQATAGGGENCSLVLVVSRLPNSSTQSHSVEINTVVDDSPQSVDKSCVLTTRYPKHNGNVTSPQEEICVIVE